MASPCQSFSEVKARILSAHANTTLQDKISFYDTWSASYQEDVANLDYKAPLLAARCVSSVYGGDRERARVLDVACGTGLAAACLKSQGFHLFTGIDGSMGMLERADETAIYQELTQCLLGQDAFPVKADIYDIVMIVGALSDGQVPVKVIQQLLDATKPGGFVCMTTRGNAENQKFKAELEQYIQDLEKDHKWRRVKILEVMEWEKAVSEQESGYIPGTVYLYQKSFNAL